MTHSRNESLKQIPLDKSFEILDLPLNDSFCENLINYLLQ